MDNRKHLKAVRELSDAVAKLASTNEELSDEVLVAVAELGGYISSLSMLGDIYQPAILAAAEAADLAPSGED